MRHRFSLIAMISLSLVACNKDEDIVIDNPDTNPATLNYEVIEYLPAPGQFINEKVSGFENITTMAEACSQAEKRLSEKLYVSLGAWGGYIVVKFNDPIPNSGDYDFAVAGNSFDTSNEPGIVWVMQDTNGNGKADDTWYELKGSWYGKEGYQKDFWITYHRPEAQSDTHWTNSDGEEGTISWLGTYHNQDFYYPNWVIEDSYTLKGTRIPDHVEQNPVTGIWTNLPYEWGYADNFGEDLAEINVDGNKVEVNRFKISDAVDSEGNSVNLENIDFIKVQTAICSSADILGENSTEVCGFYSLSEN